MSQCSTMVIHQLLTGRGRRQGLWFLLFAITVIMAIWLALLKSQSATSGNLANLVAHSMSLLITAVDQTFVILIRGLDLSVGSVISSTTALLALDLPGYVPLPAVIVLAALIGLTNGLCVAFDAVHRFGSDTRYPSRIMRRCAGYRQVVG